MRAHKSFVTSHLSARSGPNASNGQAVSTYIEKASRVKHVSDKVDDFTKAVAAADRYR